MCAVELTRIYFFGTFHHLIAIDPTNFFLNTEMGVYQITFPSPTHSWFPAMK